MTIHGQGLSFAFRLAEIYETLRQETFCLHSIFQIPDVYYNISPKQDSNSRWKPTKKQKMRRGTVPWERIVIEPDQKILLLGSDLWVHLCVHDQACLWCERTHSDRPFQSANWYQYHLTVLHSLDLISVLLPPPHEGLSCLHALWPCRAVQLIHCPNWLYHLHLWRCGYEARQVSPQGISPLSLLSCTTLNCCCSS